MGIYPVTEIKDKVKNEDGSEFWIEECNDFSGVIRYRQVRAEPWQERERTDCFCCSCGDRPGSDMACRNHGGSFGQRPCETHNMPGQPYDDTNIMPESVQAIRRARAEKEIDDGWR